MRPVRPEQAARIRADPRPAPVRPRAYSRILRRLSLDDPTPARPPAPGRAKSEPRIYPPDRHPVRRDQLSNAARTVTRKLQDEGFKAFIVGGAVRDLLL